jgi:hypothetical protein
MFIPTFLCFATISIFSVLFVDSYSSSQPLQIITKIVCLGHTFSYLLVALKNPGVEVPQASIREGLGRTRYNIGDHSLCRRCGYYVSSSSVHCVVCDVCIEGYDHHCPWTSKCIGKGNVIPFYIFLIMTPILLLYCSITLASVLQSSS